MAESFLVRLKAKLSAGVMRLVCVRACVRACGGGAPPGGTGWLCSVTGASSTVW